MSKKPAFQFYPGDWRKDQNLSRASLSAKGALIEIMCLAFESEKRGMLVTDKKPWTIEEIAYAIGGDMQKNILAIEELLNKKILKKDKKNVIFSARMVRDEKLSKVRRVAGSKGGNPNLVNQTANQKPTPSSSSSSSSSTSYHTNKETVWMNELQSDRHFYEPTCMSWSIQMPTFKQMLTDFSITNGKEHRDYHDYKTHFFSWAVKKVEKYKQSNLNSMDAKKMNV